MITTPWPRSALAKENIVLTPSLPADYEDYYVLPLSAPDPRRQKHLRQRRQARHHVNQPAPRPFDDINR